MKRELEKERKRERKRGEERERGKEKKKKWPAVRPDRVSAVSCAAVGVVGVGG
jgi:hypothetical protein